MNFKKILFSASLVSMTFVSNVNAQDFAKDFEKEHKLNLNQDGSNYFKITGIVQAWVRDLDYNPGSTVFGYPKSSGVDVGIRRYRVQMYGQLTDRVFFYSQIGDNNLNNTADRKTGFFVHDAYGEYALDKTKISVGAGLSGWVGLSRFSAPSTSTIMGIDVPLFLETTNDVTDQLNRKFSVYAKGKLGRLDYRIAFAQPMSIQKTANYVAAPPAKNASFSPEPPKMQTNAYLMYQFKDQESNLTPYAAGTYLGKKSVFNIGTGLIYQKDAMWYLDNNNQTAHHDMLHISGDVFYDAPIGSKGQAISAYGNYTHYDFGQNYIRNTAPMNPATGTADATLLNGSGNGFPSFGTGNVLYAQVGYKLKDNLIGKTTLMPYASMQHSNYDRLHQAMNYYDMGVNWLLAGHTSKFTVSYQNRPLYNILGDLIAHKSAVLAQYQVSF